MRPELIAVLIPVIALMIPIVALLTRHQQRMAEIIHQNQRAQVPASDIQELKSEIQALKEIVHQQAIALDDRSDLRTATPPPVPDVARRLIEN
jgi:hypothetical protein